MILDPIEFHKPPDEAKLGHVFKKLQLSSFLNISSNKRLLNIYKSPNLVKFREKKLYDLIIKNLLNLKMYEK